MVTCPKKALNGITTNNPRITSSANVRGGSGRSPKVITRREKMDVNMIVALLLDGEANFVDASESK